MTDQVPPRRRPGRPPIDPTDRSIDLHISLPSKLHARVQQLAERHGVSVSELFRRAVRRIPASEQ